MSRRCRRRSPRVRRLHEELECLFLGEGFLRLRTDEIASRLRCSKRTLYQLAASRRALRELVVERLLARLRADAEAAAASAPDAFRAITAYLGVVLNARASAQFFRDLTHLPAAHRRHQGECLNALERLIERGKSEGSFRDVHSRLVADLLLHVLSRLVDPAVLVRLDLSIPRALGETCEVIELGLLAHAGASRRGASPERKSWRSYRRSAALARGGQR